LSFLRRLLSGDRDTARSSGQQADPNLVRPPASSPSELLAIEFVRWSQWFHQTYAEHAQLPSEMRPWAAGPTQFEVSAFFLFVLRVTTWGTKQPTAAQEDLFDYCGRSTCKFYASIGSAQYIEDLLISRGKEYLGFLRDIKAEERQTACAGFFLELGGSPFHNHLLLAASGQVTPPGVNPPLTFANPLLLMLRPNALQIQYTNYVAPFIKILNTVMDGDDDFRNLPMPEVNTRLESALAEAAKWAIPE
jgi:hypothetical protein